MNYDENNRSRFSRVASWNLELVEHEPRYHIAVIAIGVCPPHCARTYAHHVYTQAYDYLRIYIMKKEERHEISKCHWRTRAITPLLRLLPGDLIVRAPFPADECSLARWKIRINKLVARRERERKREINMPWIVHQLDIKQHADVMSSRSFLPT